MSHLPKISAALTVLSGTLKANLNSMQVGSGVMVEDA
jgi:hypothetical protein